MLIALILSGAALVVALAAVWVAGVTWAKAPGARLWRELQLRIEDLEFESEQRAARAHKRARQENVSKATEARVQRARSDADLQAEAEAVLQGRDAHTQSQLPFTRLAAVPKDEEGQLAYYRRLISGMTSH